MSTQISGNLIYFRRSGILGEHRTVEKIRASLTGDSPFSDLGDISEPTLRFAKSFKRRLMNSLIAASQPFPECNRVHS